MKTITLSASDALAVALARRNVATLLEICNFRTTQAACDGDRSVSVCCAHHNEDEINEAIDNLQERGFTVQRVSNVANNALIIGF